MAYIVEITLTLKWITGNGKADILALAGAEKRVGNRLI